MRFRDFLRTIGIGWGARLSRPGRGGESENYGPGATELLEKLRQSEQKYRDLVDNCHGLIVTADINQNITFAGKGVKEILGYEPEEVVGTPLFRACHPDDLERAEKAFQRVIAGERLESFEARYAHKSGQWLDFIGNISPIIEARKGVQGILIAALEVTETKKLERRLQLLSSAVESSTDLVGITDLDGKFLYVNLAAARALGYEAEEVVGGDSGALTLVPEEKRHEVLRRIRREGKWASTFMAKRKDGSTFPCELFLSVIRDGTGRPLAIIGVGRDVTERLDAEERLRQTQKMETIGVLAGGIAHDFNNILGGIVGYASILKSFLPKDSPEQQYASLIEKAASRASELTGSLLSFARKGKGRPFPIDLNDVVREAVSLFQAPLRKEGNVHASFYSRPLVVEGDPTQIHQAILNVLINARDAVGSGGNIQVETCLEHNDATSPNLRPRCRPGKYAVVRIKDDGPGMDEETRNKVFEPFFTTKTDRRRTGLGLTITYNIVKNHDGCVEIESRPGHGAAVYIYLPLSEKEVPTPSSALQFAAGSETVLVIDDDETIRNVLSEMLTKLGYKPIVAESGRAGIDVYTHRKAEIDLVIVDMVLSDIGGQETFRRLKAINPAVKVLLSSAYPLDSGASEALQQGARGFIHKPYNLQELSSAVREALDRK